MSIECCADVIALYEDKLVLVNRLSTPLGLALPGGRLDPGESLEDCAIREFKEETGLELKLGGQFKTYSDPNRDPRGQKISTVYYGFASGNYKNESGKTEVVFMDLKDVGNYKSKFVFDHYDILDDYLKSEYFVNIK